MRIKKYILPALCCIMFFIEAQTAPTVNASRGLTGMPEIISTNIPGAPLLGQPMLINTAKGPVMAQGHGLAAPAYYDMDGDGMKDLLVGEFGSGMEDGHYMGNFIRVYTNVGEEGNPKFEGRFSYARPPFRYQVAAHGTPYSVDQACCMGFTPQFVDLDQDGHQDMITGQYQGEVSWFRGTEEGFLPGEALDQEGDPRGSDWIKNQGYWLYSSASFGDFTGDGLPDLITGGRSLRISKNIGNKENPKFATRELLLDVAGNPLKIYEYNEEEREYWKRMQSTAPVAGDYDMAPYVIDWDNDGTLDMLTTNSYTHKGLAVVFFFKGARTNNEYRFQQPIELFKAKDGSKAFPGSGPRISVADWNNDGINDLMIGASVATTNDQFNDGLAWRWEKEVGILAAGKDAANLNENSISADDFKRYKEYVKVPKGLSMEEFLTLRHKGYVYLMLGQHQPVQKPVNNKKKKK